MNTGEERLLIMKDVARIEAESGGFWLINLFGAKNIIEGNLLSIDLVDDHVIIFTR